MSTARFPSPESINLSIGAIVDFARGDPDASDKLHDRLGGAIETVGKMLLAHAALAMFGILTASSLVDERLYAPGSPLTLPFVDVEIPAARFFTPFAFLMTMSQLNILGRVFSASLLARAAERLAPGSGQLLVTSTVGPSRELWLMELGSLVITAACQLIMGFRLTNLRVRPFDLATPIPSAFWTFLMFAVVLLVWLKKREIDAKVDDSTNGGRAHWWRTARLATFAATAVLGAIGVVRPASTGPIDLRHARLSVPVGDGDRAIPARLGGARLGEARLDQAYLRNAWLIAAELDGATLVGADLAYAELGRRELDLTPATAVGADLREANLSYARMCGVVFGAAGEPVARFERATLSHADLTHAVLPGALLARASADRARFDACNLEHANFSGAAIESEDRVLGPANLVGASFRSASLVDADLQGATLIGADFHRADLTNANLSGADLSGANLTTDHASGLLLFDANLDGAVLSSAVIEAARADGVATDAACLYAGPDDDCSARQREVLLARGFTDDDVGALARGRTIDAE